MPLTAFEFCRQLTPKLRDITCSVVTVASTSPGMSFAFLTQQKTVSFTALRSAVVPGGELNECLDMIVEVFWDF